MTSGFLETLSPGSLMLLGMAVGDTYGRHYENLSAGEIKPLLLDDYQSGNYTDDTQQALAVSELMVSSSGFNAINLAEFLLNCYKRDIRGGYSELTTRMLEESIDPHAFLASISEEEKKNRRSDGAAMRALPIGFYREQDRVITYSKLSCEITHGHPHASAASVAISCISHERYHKDTEFKDLWGNIRHIVAEISPDIIQYCDCCASLKTLDRGIILGEHAEYGVPYTESRIFLGAILSLLSIYGRDQERLLKEAFLLGGDTDTTAAIVLGAALVNQKPETQIFNLINNLENGKFGREYLIKVGERLSEKYPSSL